MNDDRFYRLTDAWHDLMRRCGVRAGAGDAVLRRLLAAYCEPGRYHHDLRHVGDVLALLAAHRDAARRPELLELAAWFHDAVYDPRAADNEDRSADLAAAALGGLGIAAADVGRVSALVRMTRDHRADDGDTDAQLLLDADLAILGAPPQKYNDYARAIRREYAWVAEADYRAGRRAVLTRLLERPQLFRTERLRQALEAAARANLAAEIAALA